MVQLSKENCGQGVAGHCSLCKRANAPVCLWTMRKPRMARERRFLWLRGGRLEKWDESSTGVHLWPSPSPKVYKSALRSSAAALLIASKVCAVISKSEYMSPLWPLALLSFEHSLISSNELFFALQKLIDISYSKSLWGKGQGFIPIPSIQFSSLHMKLHQCLLNRAIKYT